MSDIKEINQKIRDIEVVQDGNSALIRDLDNAINKLREEVNIRSIGFNQTANKLCQKLLKNKDARVQILGGDAYCFYSHKTKDGYLIDSKVKI